MKSSIGVWDDSNVEIFYNYTLVPYEKEELFDYVISEQSITDCRKVRLKPSVKKNPEIFFCYLALTRPEDGIELNSEFYDSSSGYVISLLEEFFEAFQKLDVASCSRLANCFSTIDFKSFYIFRIAWLLDELLNYATIFREVFLESSPLNYSAQIGHGRWWDQSLGIRQSLNRIKSKCDLEKFNEISLLKPLAQVYYRADKGLGQWGALHGLEKLEAASGYFMALAEYWLKTGHYQMSLLCVHRSIDCVLLLMGHQDGYVFTTLDKLIDDDQNPVKFTKNFFKLYNGNTRNFGFPEKEFILDLNDCRNYLRETHGFRVISYASASTFIDKGNFFLFNLLPDIQAFSYKERFTLDFSLPLRLIFDIESGIDSYIDIPI